MKLLAMDPGTTETAWIVTEGSRVVASEKQRNADVLQMLRIGCKGCTHFAVEMIASYGMPVGAEVFETCVGIGRYLEAWDAASWAIGAHRPTRLVYRREVKLHLCGQARAKDPNVRMAILDRYGGKAAAVGTKKAPGPLYGVKGDVWAALGVAIVATETPWAAAGSATMAGKGSVAKGGGHQDSPDPESRDGALEGRRVSGSTVLGHNEQGHEADILVKSHDLFGAPS